MTEKVDGIVIYTDGGANPNPGFGGWGIHGYTYTNEEPKRGIGLKGWVLTENGYVAKEALKKTKQVTPVQFLDATRSLGSPVTNNAAELEAAISAFGVATERQINRLTMVLDSDYVKSGLTEWISGWIARNWIRRDGSEVPNKALWIQLLDARAKYEAAGGVVTLEWVKGHSDHPGNDKADLLATMGVTASSWGGDLAKMWWSDVTGYWNATADYNRMISHRHWYFNTNVDGAPTTKCGRTIYYLGDHGTDNFLCGKPQSDSAFSVLYLKEPDGVLELIRKYQDELDDTDFNNVIIGKLDNITSTNLYPKIQAMGKHRLMRWGELLDIYDVTKIPLTEHQRPVLQAFRAIEVLNDLERRLEQVLSGHSAVAVTDITDQLYEISEVKKKAVCKLKSEYTATTRSIKVKAQHWVTGQLMETEIPLTVGIDIAKRNTLAAIAPGKPKVLVLTWKESQVAFRYATVIELGEDIGIWAGAYSNIHTLTPIT